MGEQNIKEKNHSINFIKAIACMCVVFIHTAFPGWTGQIVNALSRTAVAFFFVVAGYYSFNSNREVVNKKALKKLKDTIILALFSIMFYFVWGIFVRWVGTGWSSVSSWFSELFTWSSLFELVILNVDIFAGHLWFVFALVYCYVALWIINKFKIENLMTWISIALLIAHIVLMNILPLFDINIKMTICRNAWFYGIPIFVLSNRLHYLINTHALKIKNLYLIFAMPVLCGIIVVERIFLGDCQLFVGNILLVYTVFIWAIQNPTTLKEKHICYMGEKYSMYIYVFHWAIINVLYKLAKMMGVFDTSLFDWLLPFVTFLCSIMVAVILDFFIGFVKKKRSKDNTL